MFDIVGIGILVVLAAALGWLARRAWQSTHRVLRWVGTTLSGLLTVVFVIALVLALVGYYKLNRKYDNPVLEITVQATPELLARGARIVSFCAGCHGAEEALPLDGQDWSAEMPFPVGSIWAPNLTPAHLGAWSDGEIIRAIREGIHPSGRSLLFMPSSAFRNLSDADVHAIVAYLRSQARIEPDTPPNKLNVLGAIMVNIGPAFEAQPPVTGPVVAPPAGPTAAYGEYLTSITCAVCHGEDLGGNPVFEAPGLVGAGRGWTEEQFIGFMRTGVRPDGRAVDGDAMPWRIFMEFLASDDDLKAIFARLAALGG